MQTITTQTNTNQNITTTQTTLTHTATQTTYTTIQLTIQNLAQTGGLYTIQPHLNNTPLHPTKPTYIPPNTPNITIQTQPILLTQGTTITIQLTSPNNNDTNTTTTTTLIDITPTTPQETTDITQTISTDITQTIADQIQNITIIAHPKQTILGPCKPKPVTYLHPQKTI